VQRQHRALRVFTAPLQDSLRHQVVAQPAFTAQVCRRHQRSGLANVQAGPIARLARPHPVALDLARRVIIVPLVAIASHALVDSTAPTLAALTRLEMDRARLVGTAPLDRARQSNSCAKQVISVHLDRLCQHQWCARPATFALPGPPTVLAPVRVKQAATVPPQAALRPAALQARIARPRF
jgi:hypothetical protein